MHRWEMALVLQGLWLCLVLAPARTDKSTEFAKGTICIGTSGRMSVLSNKEHHYRNIRDRYTNCTYVDGNLELTWLQDENHDLSFLHDIREVTGYVLISHVDVSRLILPSLQIIRGRTLFKVSVHNQEFALMVTMSRMKKLEMPALRDILRGSVGLFNNYNLCHVKTINWKEIITGTDAKHVFVYNFTEPERECPPCDKSCEEGCWGDGPENCQKFSKINCSPQCHKGRCFGPKPRDCCHMFCAGGCTGPKQNDCLACQDFYDDGVCKLECPAMKRYNTFNYSWVINPDGKYAYGATCVKECPEHLLKDSGACVRICPPKKKAVNGECVLCDGPCPKTCKGVDKLHAGNIGSFKECTVIEGSLTILELTFQGFQQIYSNFSFGPRHSKMHPDELEVFSTLKEVTEYISIQAAHEDFRNLSYFRNLEIIGGRKLTEYFSALYIVKTSLKSLNLRSLREIRAGIVAILENEKLCYAEEMNWTRIMKSQQRNPLLENNKPVEKCKAEGEVCDVQCSEEGCWGPGANECLLCANFQLGDTCLASCDSKLGIYWSGNNSCHKCHEECDLTCSGPGPGNCIACKHFRDGPFCVKQCPALKYNSSGECLYCHENCVGGCSGPENTIHENGCNSCEKAVIDEDVGLVKECMKKNESCPPGYFYEWVGPLEQGPLKPLAGKSICRKCHPRCKNCTAYGFHIHACQECVRYRRGEQCEDECPPDHYAEEDEHVCVPCAEECRGCYGPESTQCNKCRNYRVYIDGPPGYNTTKFNCTATCSEGRPHKIFPEDGGDPYCATDPIAHHITMNNNENIPAILGGIFGCIFLLGIFLAVFGYQWHQRAKSKEKTVKMTMVMSGYEDNEPLSLTNIKPNLAKLRIVKEAELRKGGILGYGAFGTVYKGVWVPDGDNVKIPVAIKVLREGTGNNANKEILEEAYIMASVDHPNLLQLLAVCMTSQLMLVTQLMPLGCLLDYVRNNKEKIGSKPLLNWCTQIAKGMAYLEDRRLVHRDLAARNVLVQTPSCVKITDFGLAKLLDINEDEYKAAGGKMPIKWLALECIQHRIFNHKSDVWAFGVTVWELLTYGGRPYEQVPAREVPDLLEKGERLPQPPVCTIDVYMIMIKCWMLDAESRPAFKELAAEFAKMARDPGRFLVIPGDRLMRLPSYTPQDEKELIQNLSSTIEGSEVVMDAEEYLQPKPRICNRSVTTSAGSMALSTPTKKYVGINSLPPAYTSSSGPESPQNRQNMWREGKYGHLETASGNSPVTRHRENSVDTRYSSDPVKMLGREGDMGDNDCFDPPTTQAQVGNLKLDLPVDEDDYLMPSLQPPASSTYMDLIDSKVLDLQEKRNNEYGHCIPDFIPVMIMDNPEYLMGHQNHANYSNPRLQGRGLQVIPPGIGVPCVGQPPSGNFANREQYGPQRSSEEESDHEYYNDCDRLKKELQPLHPVRRNETTV